MNDGAPQAASDAAFRKMIPLMMLSWACMLLLCVVLLVKRPEGCHTGLFIWGLAIGAAGIIYQGVTYRWLPRLIGASEEETARWRLQSELRQKVYFGSYVVIGVTVGVGSATTNVVWLDFGLTVFAVLSWVGGFALARTMAKRAQRQRTE
jgi:hypothetical protein